MKSSTLSSAKVITVALALTGLMMGANLILSPSGKSATIPQQASRAERTLPTEPTQMAKPEAAKRAQVTKAYGQLPMSFEANHGQTDAQVKFISRGSGYSLFLTSTEAVLALRNEKHRAASVAKSGSQQTAIRNPPAAVVRIKLMDANSDAQTTGLEELPGKTNYLIGNDPAKWRTDVSNYARVRYREVYPGVDLVYYGNQRQLEYDFVIAPGADPQNIRLGFAGNSDVRIDEGGELLLQVTDGGEIRQHKPKIYQEVDGVRREVAGGYVIDAKEQVGFQVARYDRSKPLVIDPTLVYSTLIGGSGDDSAYGVAVGTSGSAYITGMTVTPFTINDFPTANPFQPNSTGSTNAFVAKLNPQGTALVYSTYFGHAAYSLGIAVDGFGSAYVTGYALSSSSIPTTAGAFQASYPGGSNCSSSAAFVSKLSPSGSALVYSTYLGGPCNFVAATGIAVDASGNAYLTGWTSADSFPTVNPIQPKHAPDRGGFNIASARDAFVTKINATGSALIYSTFLGGSDWDQGQGIAVDTSGRAYVTGFTNSDDFPTANALQPT
jgi:hypothetical protein